MPLGQEGAGGHRPEAPGRAPGHPRGARARDRDRARGASLSARGAGVRRRRAERRGLGLPVTQPREIRRYGWIPDQPDERDHLYAAPPQFMLELPASADLRPKCPPVYDQGTLGSCTANAIAVPSEFDRPKQRRPDLVPAPPSIYSYA